jgi:hypothetical protein
MFADDVERANRSRHQASNNCNYAPPPPPHTDISLSLVSQEKLSQTRHICGARAVTEAAEDTDAADDERALAQRSSGKEDLKGRGARRQRQSRRVRLEWNA